MLSVNIICIGNLKEKYFKDACNEYLKRLTPWAKVKVVELNEEKLPSNNEKEIEAIIKAEGSRILDAIGDKAYVIAMCIEGKELSSVELSKKISDSMTNGFSTIDFIIGGSYGLSEDVKKRANFKFSMSKLTFPHQLARVMLLEQTYRALSIMNGTRYHK